MNSLVYTLHWRGGVVIEREGMRERKERGKEKAILDVAIKPRAPDSSVLKFVSSRYDGPVCGKLGHLRSPIREGSVPGLAVAHGRTNAPNKELHKHATAFPPIYSMPHEEKIMIFFV
ncbi:hypothetical protein EVAR_44456_1 [Eumeta japonica]|uniref:Uncharacterized protein n=1 Tax=Eumeta variegata TaxID=151549 RepID=A0A4C1WJQ2_EUMVA|nr:hypothetical protein EVAR_44456_1 [Eumeta japonica]